MAMVVKRTALAFLKAAQLHILNEWISAQCLFRRTSSVEWRSQSGPVWQHNSRHLPQIVLSSYFLRNHSEDTTMAAPPSKQAVLHLYHSMLRTSKSFSSYNFRNYFVRKTKDTFRNIQVCFIFTIHAYPQREIGRNGSCTGYQHVFWRCAGPHCVAKECDSQPAIWRMEIGCRGATEITRGFVNAGR